jgi:hypothetical protein
VEGVPLVRTQDFSQLSILKSKGKLKVFSPTVYAKTPSRCITSESKRRKDVKPLNQNIKNKFDARMQEMFKRRFSTAIKENIREQAETANNQYPKTRKLNLIKDKYTEWIKMSTRCTERENKLLKVQQDAHNETLVKLSSKVNFISNK